MSHYIGVATCQGQDLVDWALNLWKDVDAPIEWRWKAFEWLDKRYAGNMPNAQILNVTNVRSSRDLAELSMEQLEEIDGVFRKVKTKELEGVVA